jgi:hypothetical protein
VATLIICQPAQVLGVFCGGNFVIQPHYGNLVGDALDLFGPSLGIGTSVGWIPTPEGLSDHSPLLPVGYYFSY